MARDTCSTQSRVSSKDNPLATGLAFGLVLAPRITRIVTTMLCAVAGSDYLQLAYARLQQAAKDG